LTVADTIRNAILALLILQQDTLHFHVKDEVRAHMAELKAFIEGMPKAELHIHLEGALEPSLVRTIGQRNNLPVPSSIQDRASGYSFHDLTSFLAVYYSNMAVLQTMDDFHHLAWSYLSKAHKQNIVHAEMFFDPQAHTSRGVSFATVINGYHQAVIKAQEKLGISASLIMCFLRDMDAASAQATLKEALQYKDKIAGVGLDSDERGNPPSKFANVFAEARKEGFKLTMHCDIDQENSIEHIRQAIEEIGVDRIDHGTNILEDPHLVEVVRRKGIGLTCCPISNSVVTEDFKGKEMVDLLHNGVKVTINSDDPAYFRAYLNENLRLLADKISLTKQDLVQLQKNAFEISWIGPEKKLEYIRRLEDYATAH
jgi:adenine deaminase